MKFIIGRKLNMTQIWRGDEVIAVTGIQAGPCAVVQIKTKDKDGYGAVQIGYGAKKEKNTGKPARGHARGLGNFAHLREFIPESTAGLKRGDLIDVTTFAAGDKVKVTGISKGRGFQGVVKRHGFSGAPKTHGTKDQLRMPGSVGATGPAHVFKGRRMPGQMGNERVTVKNLEVAEVDASKNVLYVKGAVPGALNGLVLVSGPGELAVKSGKPVHAGKEEKPAEENRSGEEVKNGKPPLAAGAEAESGKETPEKVEREVVEAKERAENKKERGAEEETAAAAK